MRPTLAIFSPLPPSESGIGDYVIDQLPYLARDWSPVCVIADDAPAPNPLPVPVPVYRLSEWRADPVRDYATRRLYHLGNNQAHGFVLLEALARPDVAILHDLSLHGGIKSITVDRGDMEQYWRHFRREFGAESDGLIGLWAAGFADDRFRVFELIIVRPILESLRGVIVHSEHAAHEVGLRVPDLPSLTVPHHHRPAANPAGSREAARARLGLSNDEAIIVSAGYLSFYKQIETALRAISRARGRLPRFRYILAGACVDASRLKSAIKAAKLEDQVTITGFLPLPALEDYIEAADLVINLRWPTAGESSGVLAHVLGAGRCAVIFDFAGFADVPDGAAIKLPVDTKNTQLLEDAITRALTDPEWRQMIEKGAKSYADQALDIERCVARISAFTGQIQARTPKVEPNMVSRIDPDDRPVVAGDAEQLIIQAMRRVPDMRTREYIGLHAKRHAQVASYFPKARKGMAALELGCFHVFMPLLRHQLGYETVIGADQTPYPPQVHHEDRQMPHADGEDSYSCALFDLQHNRFPFEDCTFDFILCSAVVEHLGLDPMFMMSEINRILKFNGVLVIDTCNIVCHHSVSASLQGYSPYLHNKYQRGRSTDRHNIEFAPRDLQMLVEAAGMRIHRYESFDCYGRPETDTPRILAKFGMPMDLRGDEIIAVGVKVTDMIDRFPSILYEPGPLVKHSSSLGPWVGGATRDRRVTAPV